MCLGRALADRPRFELITEHPETIASAFQLECASARYSLLESLTRPGDLVVEVGCGTGVGLARLGEAGRRVVGADLVLANLRVAADHSPVIAADAQRLPVRDGSAALTAILEAIYYMPDQRAAVAEMARATASGGRLVLSCPDPRRSGFLASPFATHYPGPAELRRWLEPWCAGVEVRGAFPVAAERRTVVVARAVASRMRLVPKTMHRRGQLKRLLGRRTGTLADFVLDASAVPTTVTDPETPAATHVMLYAVGTRL